MAPAPGQCYYTIDPKIAEAAHRLANDGVVEYCARRPDRFVGLGVVTLQEPEIAVRELDYIMCDLKLKGVEILTNVDGQELSDPKFRPFFARAEQLGAFIMMHPNGFTHGQRLTHYYLNNVLGNPLDTTLALHNLIFSGTLARFPDLKLMAVHGGGYLPGYSGRIDHAWGARADSHGDLPLPPTAYLRQVYLDTVVFTYHQLAYLIDVFGPDRILMGTDYPFDIAEYNPIGHIRGYRGWTRPHWPRSPAAMPRGCSASMSSALFRKGRPAQCADSLEPRLLERMRRRQRRQPEAAIGRSCGRWKGAKLDLEIMRADYLSSNADIRDTWLSIQGKGRQAAAREQPFIGRKQCL